jgi:hypothetical protein
MLGPAPVLRHGSIYCAAGWGGSSFPWSDSSICEFWDLPFESSRYLTYGHRKRWKWSAADGKFCAVPPKIEKSTTLKTAGTPIHVYITIDDRYSYIYYIHKIMYIYTHMDKRLYMIYNVACLGPSTLILRCQFELWLKWTTGAETLQGWRTTFCGV